MTLNLFPSYCIPIFSIQYSLPIASLWFVCLCQCAARVGIEPGKCPHPKWAHFIQFLSFAVLIQKQPPCCVSVIVWAIQHCFFFAMSVAHIKGDTTWDFICRIAKCTLNLYGRSLCSCAGGLVWVSFYILFRDSDRKRQKVVFVIVVCLIVVGWNEPLCLTETQAMHARNKDRNYKEGSWKERIEFPKALQSWRLWTKTFLIQAQTHTDTHI